MLNVTETSITFGCVLFIGSTEGWGTARKVSYENGMLTRVGPRNYTAIDRTNKMSDSVTY